MVISSRQHHHARHCHGQDRRYDRGRAQARLCVAGHRRLASRLIQGCLAAALILFCAVGHVTADNIRIATFNAELTRKGPGLLLRDILKEEDPQVAAFTALMRDIRPDIIALQGIDYDLEHRALTALTKVLEKAGLPYPYSFTAAPNAGQTSRLDLNGNGRLGDADDAHGFGRYTSMGGMAVLSRFEIMHDAVEDYTNLLWRNLDGHIFPFVEGRPFGGEDAFAAHRLSSRNHWVIPILTPNGASLRLMTLHTTPPLYDGNEDRNGRRNHDEVAFWNDYIAQNTGTDPFILLGTANIDPKRGSGRCCAIQTLLGSEALQNPFGDTPTAVFSDKMPDGLQVDYLLPSSQLRVTARGMRTDDQASRHSLLWVDVELPNP